MERVPEIAVTIDLDWALKHHHETFSGIQQCLKNLGWRCSVWTKLPETLMKRGQKRFDGVVGRISAEDAETARAAGIPVVNVWLSSPAEGVVTVCQDEGKAGRMSASHLMARGIRRLAYLGERGARYCKEQLAQFREVAKEADVPVDHLLIARNTIFHQNVGQDLHDLLMRWISSQETPFGVFAATDMFARNLANAVLELGLRIPDDVAIVGASNETMVCTTIEPTLSSIDYGFARVGFEACEVLVKMVNGEELPESPVLLPPAELVARESSDAFLVDNEIVARALKYMISECHRPIKVGDIVDASHTSRRTLTRQFQNVRGRSVTDELTRIRMGRVKRLLVESDLLIKEIAASSGYSSVNRLCESFRREEGITPQEYRKKYMKSV